jgi:hypothetical protein
MLDPLERLGKLQLPLPGPNGPNVGRGHWSAVAGAGPGVVREACPDGHEQHERAMLLGAGALTWLGVAVGVNPLDNLFIIHNG